MEIFKLALISTLKSWDTFKVLLGTLAGYFSIIAPVASVIYFLFKTYKTYLDIKIAQKKLAEE